MDPASRTTIPRTARAVLLLFLSLLAAAGLAWGIRPALRDSDDLMRRAEEAALFARGQDPYHDPDMTYPPSAPPIFAPFLVPFAAAPAVQRAVWLGLNLLALGALITLVIRVWGRDWPAWLQAAVGLTILAMKPVRGGIALGQFHLIPLVLGILAVIWARKRPVPAGICLGIALIKPTMALPIACLALTRGWWKVLLTAALVQGTAWLTTSARLGIDPLTLGREWIALARLQDDAGVIDLPSLIRRNRAGSEPIAGPLALAVLGLTTLGFVALRRRSDRALLALACFAAAVFAYHRAYDLVLLIPAFALFVELGYRRRNRQAWAAPVPATALAILLIWPSHPSITGPFESVYERAFPPLAYLALLGLIVAMIRLPDSDSDPNPEPTAP